MLADPGRGEVLLYTPHGEEAGTFMRPGKGAYDFTTPGVPKRLDDGLLLSDGGSHWLWLDDDLKPFRQLDFADSPTADGEVIGPPFSWDVTRDGRLFGSLHVIEKDGEWWTGLAEVMLVDPPRLRRILEVDRFSGEAAFHRLRLDTVAIVGERGYFLQFGDEVTVLSSGPRRTLTNVVPERLRSPPTLPQVQVETVDAVFRALARAPLAAGIYSHAGELYLLEREPLDEGARWRLHAIDPEKDRIVRSVELPTRADWIKLAPGPEHWAILEMGPVRGLLEQDHDALTLLPSAWVEQDRSPLEAGAARVACRATEATDATRF